MQEFINAFVFPGQGAQAPGMGKDFYDSYLVAKETFQEADDILSFPLSKLIFSGSKEELMLTKNSQPAIFVVSMAILRVLAKELPELLPTMCGGLSLGEYSALVAAEKISFKNCLELVYARGSYMQEAATLCPGGMAAVLGLSEEMIKESGFKVANVNSPGQVVIAGTKLEIERAQEELKLKGAKRVIPLEVSGAFHSDHMQSARQKLSPIIQECALHTSSIGLVMNVVGRFVDDVEEMKEYLSEQVTAPTRWMDCVLAMAERNPQRVIEVGPSQVAAMCRKIGIAAPIITVQKVEDLESVYEATSR